MNEFVVVWQPFVSIMFLYQLLNANAQFWCRVMKFRMFQLYLFIVGFEIFVWMLNGIHKKIFLLNLNCFHSFTKLIRDDVYANIVVLTALQLCWEYVIFFLSFINRLAILLTVLRLNFFGCSIDMKPTHLLQIILLHILLFSYFAMGMTVGIELNIKWLEL